MHAVYVFIEGTRQKKACARDTVTMATLNGCQDNQTADSNCVPQTPTTTRPGYGHFRLSAEAEFWPALAPANGTLPESSVHPPDDVPEPEIIAPLWEESRFSFRRRPIRTFDDARGRRSEMGAPG